MANLKKKRYEWLVQKTENFPYTDDELSERVQLFYELYPEHQYWRDSDPTLTPRDVWGVDTSVYAE
jgi:hypothetical protein